MSEKKDFLVFRVVDHNVEDFTIKYVKAEDDQSHPAVNKVYRGLSEVPITEDMWVLNIRKNDKE